MQRSMLKSKIHRATVTGAELNYEGSISVDEDLMRAADLLPDEQVHVLNVNNAARFVTYVIPAEAGSGAIVLNGAAARLASIGDKVIILSYGLYEDREVSSFEPKKVFVDDHNMQ